ncbi:MAG: DUF1552 domain-containing protein [Verrucomicrobiota bacterium]
MNTPTFLTRRTLSRRTLLRGAGAAMTLPFLDAMAKPLAPAPPKRLLAINIHLGFMEHNFLPKGTGRDYQPSKYGKFIDAWRDQFTIITGTSHPGVSGAHESDQSFLTAAPGVGQPGFRNTVSMDQLVAREVAGKTRFTHLPLSHHDGKRSLAWSASGANIPPIDSPVALFQMMFLEGTDKEKAQRIQDLKDGRSILDSVLEASKSLSAKLGQADRDKLDQFFTSVRDTEHRFLLSKQWVEKPKPKTNDKPPKKLKDAAEFVQETALMYDMIHLALQSDSSRVITYNQPNLHRVLPDQAVKVGYHALSHHNNDPEKMRQLEVIEIEQMKAFAKLLDTMSTTAETRGSLLDNTVLLFGSNFGNASTHATNNLPIVLAGGGFNHGEHIACDPSDNTPLSNLFVTMLQKMGLEQDKFGSSTGTLLNAGTV